MSLSAYLRNQVHRVRGHGALRDPEAFLAPVRGEIGLEVGGPSAEFQEGGRLPVYPVLERVDGIQFSEDTVWHGDMAEGRYEPGGGGTGGNLYIREGSDLGAIGDGTIGALLSSHVIEHFANPIGALREWRRVVRPGGHLVFVVPHFEGTFDHRRPVTPLEHLIADDEAGTGEDDSTHFAEFLELCDVERNPPARDRAAFEARVADNLTQRTVHHHVFDTRAVLRVLDYLGLAIRAVEARWPHDIFVLAQRPESEGGVDNTSWLAPGAAWSRDSPFRSDRG